MNILPMRYFIEVVKAGGISSASRNLYITQQTLSSHIAGIEKELGCLLFQRRPFFQLTHEGQIFYRYCQKITELDQAMHKEFEELSTKPSGLFRIGISQTRSKFLMPGALAVFQKEYDKIQIQLVEATNDQLVHKLLENQVDVVIGSVPVDLPELCVEELYREKMVLLVPRREAYQELLQAIEQSCGKLAGTAILSLLAKCSFVNNTSSDIVGRYTNQFLTEKNIVPQISAISDNAETCIELCKQGLGLYMCPSLYVQNDSDLLQELKILEVGIEYPIYGAYRKNIYISRRIPEFLEIVAEIAGMKA